MSDGGSSAVSKDRVHQLIINADDFGLNTDANHSILEAFQQGLCSSTTLMANMPGFEEACEIAHEHKLTDSVGLHLNLGEGYPLVDALRRCSTFCGAEGRFQLSASHLTLFLNAAEKMALAEEIRAQVGRCRSAGIPLTHLDSHRHLHTQWAILGVVLAVARQEGIPYVRIPRNSGSSIGPVLAMYKWLLIRKIESAAMRATDYFGSVRDYLWLKDAGGVFGSMEIMIHPRRVEPGLLGNYPGENLLTDEIRKVDSYRNAVSFRQIQELAPAGCRG